MRGKMAGTFSTSKGRLSFTDSGSVSYLPPVGSSMAFENWI